MNDWVSSPALPTAAEFAEQMGREVESSDTEPSITKGTTPVACELTEQQRNGYLGLINELRRGRVSVRHPDSPMDQGGHDSELAEPTARLLKRWLTRPQGYAIDVVVRSAEPLSGFAIQRIARDVFGDTQPWVVLPVDDLPAIVGGDSLVPMACTPGLPGLIPLVRVLNACAVPSVQVLPGPLPEGPGVVPCLVRVAQAEIKPDAMNVNELRQRSGAMYGTPLQQANEHLAQRYGVPLDSLCNSHGLWPSVVP